MTAETPSDDIGVLPNIKGVKRYITTNIPLRMKAADNKIAIGTGIPFSSFKSGGGRASEKNCVWKGRVSDDLFADRTFGSDCPQPAANHNLAIGND